MDIGKLSIDEYDKLVTGVFKLISYEINKYETHPDQSDILPKVYPQIAIMYEFFRMLRGEAFDGIVEAGGPHGKYYRQENTLKERLLKLREELDPEDDRTKYFLSQALEPFLVLEK